jgi:hypothetical protein
MTHKSRPKKGREKSAAFCRPLLPYRKQKEEVPRYFAFERPQYGTVRTFCSSKQDWDYEAERHAKDICALLSRTVSLQCLHVEIS